MSGGNFPSVTRVAPESCGVATRDKKVREQGKGMVTSEVTIGMQPLS